MKTQTIYLRRAEDGELQFAGSEENPTAEALYLARQHGLVILRLSSEYDERDLPPITGVEDLSQP